MKNYIANNLIKGESVVHQTNLHWSVYAFCVTMAVLGILNFMAGIGVVFLLISLISFFLNSMRRKHFGFTVTNRRIIAKSNFLNTVDIPLKQVESVTVDQGFFGACFDFGSVVISGTGGTKTILTKVTNPDDFKLSVMEQIA